MGRNRAKSVEFKCKICKCSFKVPSYRAAQAKKRNSPIRFCSNACKVIGLSGKNSPSYLHFKVSGNFTGTGPRWWKRKLLKEVGRCEECGWDKHKEILDLHHIDLDKKNNVRENLKLLCPNCHDWIHYKGKSGNYCFRKMKGVTGSDHPRFGNTTRHDLYKKTLLSERRMQ